MTLRQPDSPDPSAQRVRDIFAKDRLMALLGVELVEGRSGHVVLRYVVQDTVVQEHGTCHGGVIFSLADAACGIAASAYGQPAVTQVCTVNFLRPAPLGTRLTATATERSRAGRSVILDVSVDDDSGTRIADLRGTARLVSLS